MADRNTTRDHWQRLRGWARRMKRDGIALWFACRDTRTPLVARLLCGLVVAYAMSPIDLIPDFVPVLGLLDDLLLLPALIWLAIRLMPPAVMQAARARADDWLVERRERPRSRWGALLIVAVWITLAGAAWWLWQRHVS